MAAANASACGQRVAIQIRAGFAARGTKGNGPKGRTGDNGMSDDLTNSQIALLCDIGELHLPKLTGDQKRDLEQLISEGYVGPTEGHAGSAFMLTAKGVEFLGKRGAGLNEA
jgi:hypothetical protein